MKGIKELRVQNYGPYYFQSVTFDEEGNITKNLGIDKHDSYSHHSLTDSSISLLVDLVLDGKVLTKDNCHLLESKYTSPYARGLKKNQQSFGTIYLQFYGEGDLGFVIDFSNSESFDSKLTAYTGTEQYTFSLSEYTEDIHQHLLSLIARNI